MVLGIQFELMPMPPALAPPPAPPPLRRPSPPAGAVCRQAAANGGGLSDLDTVHLVMVMMHMSEESHRGALAALNSVLAHRSGPLHLHFIVSDDEPGAETARWLYSLFDADLERVRPAADGAGRAADVGGFSLPLVEHSVHVFARDEERHALPPEDVIELRGKDHLGRTIIKLVGAPDLLRQHGLHRVAMVDCCDVLVLGDVRELWQHFDRFVPGQTLFACGRELTDVYMQASSDWGEQLPLLDRLGRAGQWGLNTGVMLLDLDAMAEARFGERVTNNTVQVYREQLRLGHPLRYQEQDMLILWALRHPQSLLPLPCAWNTQLTEAINARMRTCPQRARLLHGPVKTFDAAHASGLPELQAGFSRLLRHHVQTLPEAPPSLARAPLLLASSVDDYLPVLADGLRPVVGHSGFDRSDEPLSSPVTDWTYGYVTLAADDGGGGGVDDSSRFDHFQRAFVPFARVRQAYEGPKVDNDHNQFDQLLQHCSWLGGDPAWIFGMRRRPPHRFADPCSADEALGDACWFAAEPTTGANDTHLVFARPQWSNRPETLDFQLTQYIGVGRFEHWANEHVAAVRRWHYSAATAAAAATAATAAAASPRRHHLFLKYGVGAPYRVQSGRRTLDENPDDGVTPPVACDDLVEVAVLLHRQQQPRPELLIRRLLRGSWYGNMVMEGLQTAYVPLDALAAGDQVDVAVAVVEADARCPPYGVKFPVIVTLTLFIE